MQEVIKNIINKLEKRAEEHDFEGNRFAERKYWEDYCAEKNKMQGLNEAIEIVKQEAEEYNNGWIPCSERLPEEPEENPLFEYKTLELYLVTTKYGSSEQDKKYPFRAFWNGINFTDGMNILDVVAWMPLPQPYQPKGE